MERLLKLLDDCDDLLVVFRVQAPAIAVTAALGAAFLAGLGCVPAARCPGPARGPIIRVIAATTAGPPAGDVMTDTPDPNRHPPG